MKHTAILLLSFLPVAAFAQTLPYQNPKLPIHQRVEDLLGRMTLAERVAQMCQYVGIEHIRQSEARMSAARMKKSDAAGFYPGLRVADIERMTEQGKIGSFLHVVTLEEANALQKLAMKSRWRIPLLLGIDAIHGDGLVRGATVYPSPISLASTFDPALAEQIARATAEEVRANGAQWTFSPNVDVARDARWGRVGETFGEDPLLVSRMGAALVRGYQGKDLSGPNAILACAKHFAAGGDPPNGLNAAPMDVSERTVREVYLPPFKAAVDAGAYTVMTAHNEINGVPCHANGWLMNEVLRREFGFVGFVVSDWMDIERLATLHHVAANQKEAVYQTVTAGMDMHMHGPNFFGPLVQLVQAARISEERINSSARRILTAKFRLGLFENALVDPARARAVTFNDAHQQLALEAARKAIVLLKNDGVLPIDPNKVKRVFVTGPNANTHAILGDWVLEQPEENVTTIVEGLRQIAPPGVAIDYFDCGASVKHIEEARVREAARKAKGAGVAILVMGENPLRYENKEKTSGENVDRSRISLAGNQLDLVKSVSATGVPTVVVLVGGRPLGVEWIAGHVPALVEAWEPGCKGGQALAEVLFGKVNPSGKLPISFPRSAGHIQTIYNHKPSQYFRKYVIGKTSPLFTFGDGLSYTTFQYSNLKVPARIDRGQPIPVSIDVKNTGGRTGDEVVMVFLHDVVASVTRPVRELKAFRRISLAPGETKTVQFKIDYNELAFYNRAMRRVVEPGRFDVFVGDQKASFEIQ